MTNFDDEPRRQHRNAGEVACASCGEVGNTDSTSGCCEDCLQPATPLEDWDDLGDVD